MALKVKDGEIPKDAIILTEREAHEYQWKLIEKWQPQSDIWPFKYGIGLLGAVAGISSIYINNHYRSKLFLGRYGSIATYLPNVIVPAIVAAAVHRQFITESLVLDPPSCPVCLQTRAAMFQGVLATVYPVILSPLSNFMFAARYATYRLPHITDPIGNIKVWLKLTRPIGKSVLYIFFAQALAASTQTYFEAKSLYTIREKMLLVEEQYDNMMSQR